MESHLRKKSRKWEIRVAPLLLLLPPLLISLDDGFCRSTLSPIFAKYRDERRGTDADEGDPSKMLRDDDTFVLTGVKSDIALFPLQLPRRTQTWTDLWPARRNPSLARNGWKCHSHSRLPRSPESSRRLSRSFVRSFFKSCDLSNQHSE